MRKGNGEDSYYDDGVKENWRGRSEARWCEVYMRDKGIYSFQSCYLEDDSIGDEVQLEGR